MTSMTLKAIDASIASIVKRGKALRTDCHKTLVAVIEHYIEHGDFTRLKVLTAAVKDSLGSSLSAAMNLWVHSFVPSLKWDDETKAFVHLPKTEKKIIDVTGFKTNQKDAEGKTITFTGNARELMFYNMEREAPQKPFDLAAALAILLNRAKSAYQANTTEGKQNAVNIKQIEELEKVVKHIGDYKPEVDAISEASIPASGRKDEQPVAEVVKKDDVKASTKGRKASNKNTAPVEGVQEAA